MCESRFLDLTITHLDLSGISGAAGVMWAASDIKPGIDISVLNHVNVLVTNVWQWPCMSVFPGKIGGSFINIHQTYSGVRRSVLKGGKVYVSWKFFRISLSLLKAELLK